MSFNLSPATEIRADSHGLVQLDLFGNPTSEEPTYYRSPHRVAYPGMSRNSRDRIETHTKSLKTLLAKDGVIYKEAMGIVAEDVKKIMAEEFYQVYMKANEERIIEKEKESPPCPPPAKRAKFGTKAMPIDPLAEFIDLCVDICP